MRIPRPTIRLRAASVAVLAALAAGACGGGSDESGPEPTSRAVTTSTTGARTTTTVGMGAGPGKLTELWSGLDQPVLVTSPPGDPRVFVVQQTGKILMSPDGVAAPQPWLDLSTEVTTAGTEQGLLGLAFHPDFASNGRLFVNYTDTNGDTRVVQYFVDPAGQGAADVKGKVEILGIDQPFPNHNGGNLVFGPDGLLYVGTGDGGSANDPQDNAQNPKSLLGKMLRIDVDDDSPEPEVWAVGLRNPWRYSFDAETGDLWIGDVGQDTQEEIDVLRAGTPAGANFGWPTLEGTSDNPTKKPNPKLRSVEPTYVYPTENGTCAVTGGFVYRGPGLPAYQGRYFFADYCGGEVVTVDAAKPGKPENMSAALGAPSGMEISSFGVDASGRLYVVDHNGKVLRLESA